MCWLWDGGRGDGVLTWSFDMDCLFAFVTVMVNGIFVFDLREL